MAAIEQHCTILFNSDRVQSVQQVMAYIMMCPFSFCLGAGYVLRGECKGRTRASLFSTHLLPSYGRDRNHLSFFQHLCIMPGGCTLCSVQRLSRRGFITYIVLLPCMYCALRKRMAINAYPGDMAPQNTQNATVLQMRHRTQNVPHRRRVFRSVVRVLIICRVTRNNVTCESLQYPRYMVLNSKDTYRL